MKITLACKNNIYYTWNILDEDSCEVGRIERYFTSLRKMTSYIVKCQIDFAQKNVSKEKVPKNVALVA